jgi:hypothetical protein
VSAHFRPGESRVHSGDMRWLFLSAILAAGCPGSEPPPACKTVDTACSPQYVGNFSMVYANTIAQDCGTADGSCHSANGDADLSFATIDESYDNLLARYVTPGDPGCSELIVRTSSPGKDYQMPKGAPLNETEQCALRKWVEAGAPR